jgi:hypothetical protein
MDAGEWSGDRAGARDPARRERREEVKKSVLPLNVLRMHKFDFSNHWRCMDDNERDERERSKQVKERRVER